MVPAAGRVQESRQLSVLRRRSGRSAIDRVDCTTHAKLLRNSLHSWPTETDTDTCQLTATSPCRGAKTRIILPMSLVSDSAEWLEVDGLGGFASGTTTGIRTRRYHALLLTG